MSQYLRDEFLKNLTLKKTDVKEINEVLLGIRDKGNTDLDENNLKFIKLSYIIRFDNKGFLLHNFNEVLSYFDSAKKIERFIFVLKSNEHEKTFREKGKGLEIRFDAKDPNNCSIVVQDDDTTWANSNFLILKETLNKFTNHNFIARNYFIPFIIQILGVLSGLLLSLGVALNLAPQLKIVSSFAFVFIATFLLFSNIWTYLYVLCLKTVDYFWPNISFKERGGIYNLSKKLIAALFFAYCITIIGWVGLRIWHFLLNLRVLWSAH